MDSKLKRMKLATLIIGRRQFIDGQDIVGELAVAIQNQKV